MRRCIQIDAKLQATQVAIALRRCRTAEAGRTNTGGRRVGSEEHFGAQAPEIRIEWLCPGQSRGKCDEDRDDAYAPEAQVSGAVHHLLSPVVPILGPLIAFIIENLRKTGQPLHSLR